MKFSRLLAWPLLAMLALTQVSCDTDEPSFLDGTVVLTVTNPLSSNGGGRAEEAVLESIVITIEDENGNVVLDNERLDIRNFGDQLVTDPISLDPGNYELTEFWIEDDSAAIMLATPIEGSTKAHLVSDPLPIVFSISADAVTEVSPEVLSTEGSTPTEFGYAFFTFSEVETFEFLLGVFTYDGGYQMTAADLTVSNTDGTVLATTLGDYTNTIELRADAGDYTLTIGKSGYTTYSNTFTVDSLKAHTNDPLEVVLLAGTDTLVLQPNATDGKDALVWSNRPDINMDESQDFHAMEWTWSQDGGVGTRKGLIDFDLSSLPSGATITGATLYLYHNPNSPENSYTNGHSSLTASNAYKLERIVEAWEEDVVTWNTQPATTSTNAVLVGQTATADENAVLDVTALIQDQVDNPTTSHGLMLSLQGTSYYAAVIFGSSDAADASIHPKLVVTYE